MLEQVKYTNGSASALIKTGAGSFYGIIVNSHTSGTLKFWDSLTATGTVVMNTFTFPAGSGMYLFPKGVSFYTGLYATVGGTIDFTILSA